VLAWIADRAQCEVIAHIEKAACWVRHWRVDIPRWQRVAHKQLDTLNDFSNVLWQDWTFDDYGQITLFAVHDLSQLSTSKTGPNMPPAAALAAVGLVVALCSVLACHLSHAHCM
jgi:hypothetical protein